VNPFVWTALLLCLLICSAMFFSANALALRIFSRAKLQEAFKELKNNQSADRLIENVIKDKEKLTLACSLYRLIFNLLILVLLLVIFTAGLKNPSISNFAAAFVIAGVIFSIFSLAVPHAWAKYAGEKLLSRTYKPLLFLAAALMPVFYILKFLDGLVRRLAGVAQTSPGQLQEEKQQDFLTDLEQQKIEGVVDEEEQEMIESVLELDNTTADEIMTPRTDIVALEVHCERATVLKTIETAGHSRVPVYEDNIDNIIGFVYAKDLLSEIGKNETDFKLKSKLRQPYFVPESKTVRVLLHEFQNQKLHIAVVLDEYGGTAGIVSLEDILEELVGEIADEYEKMPAEPIKQIDENTIELDARTNIDDINDQLESELPEDEDYDTIGGFVFSHLGYIPKTGETFDYKNIKFTITDAERRRIKRLKLQKIESSQP